MARPQSPPFDPDQFTVSAAELVAMTGRSRSWVFSVLREQGVEKIEGGRYRLQGVMRAFGRHFEELIADQGARAASANRMRGARSLETELRISEKMKGLVSREDADRVVDTVTDLALVELDRIAPALAELAGSNSDIPALIAGVHTRIRTAQAQAHELARTGIDPTDPQPKRRKS